MTAYIFNEILTLEARNNILLDVMTTHLGLNNQQVFTDISSSLEMLKKALKSKNIKYPDLKRALTPSKDKYDIALVFDSNRAKSSWYGKEIIEEILPLFDRRSSHSILCGDWIYAKDHNDWLCHEMTSQILHCSEAYSAQWQNIYFVYINNLSSLMLDNILKGICENPVYLGYLDMRFSSPIKAFISTLLVRAFIKHKNIIIQSHEDDRNEFEDENLLSYNFKKFNYENRSVPGWMYGMFLSYKIERPIFIGNDKDTRFSLNAISTRPIDLRDFKVEIDEDKLEYLKSEKKNSLKRANLHSLSALQVASKIRQKIKSNYIYNLARSENGETIKFNIMLENSNIAKNECALEYIPSERVLRLITFF